MRSWSAPEPPRLPGMGGPLRLYNTSAAAVQPTEPGPTARMYVCGITPYDATHLGHANTYLAFDLIGRVWRDSGHTVRYVQNATDVDDPLLERAAQTGEDWRALAEREIELYRQDMAALGILPPSEYIGAVESVPLITDLILSLKERGAAYQVDGDIYFPIENDPAFGEVSRLSPTEMMALFGERGGDPSRPGKRHPLDCLLWQGERPGEPAWDSPFGPGRPGWHVECSAIALHFLGMGFDLAGGGSDLAFPHHEMSASEAQVAVGEHPYAKSYVHAGMVGLDGEKMSKSRGNLVFVSRLRRDHDPMAVRMALLAHHYRADWEWTADQLARALVRLARWKRAVARSSGPHAAALLNEVRSSLADDLDTPRALAAIDRWASDEGSDASAPRLVRQTADALLGIPLAP